MGVAIVATVRNEEASIRRFLDSVLGQTRTPDEAIVVDGGSSDRTFAILQEYAERTPWLKPTQKVGANIAAGRNLGIAQADAEIIAVTDAGCELEPQWLERIVAPFIDSGVSVVGGFYTPDTASAFDMTVMRITLPIYKPLDNFLPSSRSVAFRKQAWAEAGGYPEWLYTAEDTSFVLKLKELGYQINLARLAIVKWKPRTGQGLWRQYHNYARGDGHAKLFVPMYLGKLAVYATILALVALTGVSPVWGLGGLTLFILHCGRYGLRVVKRGTLRELPFVPLAVLFVDSASLIGFARGLAEGRPQRNLGGT